MKSATVLDDRYGLNVVFGGNHTIRNLTFTNLAARIKEVDRTLVKRIVVSTSQDFPNASRSSFNLVGKRSRVVQVTARGSRALEG